MTAAVAPPPAAGDGDGGARGGLAARAVRARCGSATDARAGRARACFFAPEWSERAAAAGSDASGVERARAREPLASCSPRADALLATFARWLVVAEGGNGVDVASRAAWYFLRMQPRISSGPKSKGQSPIEIRLFSRARRPQREAAAMSTNEELEKRVATLERQLE